MEHWLLQKENYKKKTNLYLCVKLMSDCMINRVLVLLKGPSETPEAASDPGPIIVTR